MGKEGRGARTQDFKSRNASEARFIGEVSQPPPHWVFYVEQEGVDFIIKTS